VSLGSTARTEEDQARAMFNNLVRKGDSLEKIQQRIADQKKLYKDAGDAVVEVFEDFADGTPESGPRTADELRQMAGAIRDAMEAEITEQGADKVSRHCADTSKMNVVDIGYGSFTPATKAKFLEAANKAEQEGRLRVLNEPGNSCIHLEIPQPPPPLP
jgi:hypothetical protein